MGVVHRHGRSAHGGQEEGAGLYRIEVTEGPGSGVRVLNQPVPPVFRESVKMAEQNLYSRARELVGDRDPRAHEFSVYLRAVDAAKSSSALGVAVLLAFSGALLEKSLKDGLVVVGALNLGGSVDPVYNAVSAAELAGQLQLVTVGGSRKPRRGGSESLPHPHCGEPFTYQSSDGTLGHTYRHEIHWY